MKSSDKRSTISTSCIFLKIKGKADDRSKRALMGPSIESLYRVANRLYRAIGTVKAIYNEQGAYVSNMQQVIPGSTYYVSSKEPDAEKIRESEESIANSYIGHSILGFGKGEIDLKKAPSAFYRLFGANTAFDPEIRDEVNKFRKKEYQDAIKREKIEARRLREEEERRRIENDRARKRGLMLLAAKRKAGAGGEEEDFYDSDTSITDLLHRRSDDNARHCVIHRFKRGRGRNNRAANDDGYYYGEEEDKEGFDYSVDENGLPRSKRVFRRSRRSRRMRRNGDFDSLDEEADGRTCVIDDILELLIGETALTEKLDDVIPMFKKNSQKLIDTAPELEIKQEEFWFMNLFNAIRSQFCPEYDRIRLEERLAEEARNILQCHRMPINGESILNMKIGLAGPRHSGKSTFLTVFASELLAELVYSGHWKKTFLFFANVQDVILRMNSPEQVYNTMCDVTIDALGIQRPHLQHHTAFLKKFFASVITSKTTAPTIPPSSSFAQENPGIAQGFRRISQRIHSTYNDDEGFKPFIQLCMLLPHYISEAAYFTNVIFLIDNFESSTYDIIPSGKFATNLNGSLPLGEFWKVTMESSNFFITCESQVDFFCSLQPFAGTADQFSGLEIITTLGMIDDFEDDTLVKLEVDGYSRPFIMTAEHLGGCGAFIAMWMNLCDEFDEYNEMPDDDPDKEEARLELITESQSVFDALFVAVDDVDPEEAAFLVTEVRRESRSVRGEFN